LESIDNVHDLYSRYWLPIHWSYALLYEARLHGKIASDYLLDKVTGVRGGAYSFLVNCCTFLGDSTLSARIGFAAQIRLGLLAAMIGTKPYFTSQVPIPLLYPQV